MKSQPTDLEVFGLKSRTIVRKLAISVSLMDRENTLAMT